MSYSTESKEAFSLLNGGKKMINNKTVAVSAKAKDCKIELLLLVT
jgi:hypothetical protein